MAARKSRARSAERRAPLDALISTARGIRADTLIAWLPLLGELAEANRHASGKMVTMAVTRLRLLRRWAELRAANDRERVTNQDLYERVSAEAQAADPTLRVSPRSIQRWHHEWNRVGPGALAAGPSSLMPRYRRASRGC